MANPTRDTAKTQPRSRQRELTVRRAMSQFLLAALLALAVLGAGSAAFFKNAGTREAVHNARVLGDAVNHRIIGETLKAHPEILTAAPGTPAYEQFSQVVRERVLKEPIRRLKIWRADGTILYSDEVRLVGRQYPLGAEEQRALRTHTIDTDVSNLAAPENQFEPKGHKLLEVYVGERVDGQDVLVETYQSFSSILASGHRIWLSFVPGLVGGLILLQLIQLPLAWKLARRVHEGRQDREALLRRALDASDIERRRIAGDLHDGVVQDLAALGFLLAAASDTDSVRSDLQLRQAMERAGAGTRQCIKQLRTLLVEIYPPNLHSAGLESALSDLLAPVAARGIHTTLEVHDTIDLRDGTEELFFRTAQEAVRNVVTHAQARSLRLALREDGDRAVLVIEDDGRGFAADDVLDARTNGHFGLRLLSEMAADSGAVLTIDSQPGQGTRLYLQATDR